MGKILSRRVLTHSDQSKEEQSLVIALLSHLGSDRSIECLTRPQYVFKSYCDDGKSLLPGRDADIAARLTSLLQMQSLFFKSPLCKYFKSV